MNKRPTTAPRAKVLDTELQSLAPSAQALMLRLLSVLKANNLVLPEEMLDAIESISLEGAHPQWQTDEMQKILDRWTPSALNVVGSPRHHRRPAGRASSASITLGGTHHSPPAGRSLRSTFAPHLKPFICVRGTRPGVDISAS
jgi:hypothetical protein